MLRLIAINLMRRRARTVLTAVGIAVGVATVVALLSLTAGLQRSAGQLIHLGNADFGLFQGGLADVTASTLPESLLPRARAVEGVADVAPVQIVTGELPGRSSFIVFGSPPGNFLHRRLVMVAGRRAATPQEVLIGDLAAGQLGLGPGGLLQLRQGTFRVVGVYHSGVTFEDQGAVVPLTVAQQLAGRSGQMSMIAVLIQRGHTRDEMAARMEKALPGTVAFDEPGEVSRADTNSLLIEKAALVIALLALVIGGIAVTNTMLISAIERQRELGVLAAVGWSPAQVARLVFGEGVAVSVLGATLGLLLGIAGGELAVRALSASTFVSPDVTAWGLGRGLIVGVAIGVLGGLYPAWRVSRLAPVSAMGRE